MSCLCIGGVCIPYTALFPVLIIALQWIASQFAKVGLLPASVAKRLGLNPAGKKVENSENSKTCEDKGCCSGGKGSSGKSSSKNSSSSTIRSESIATAMTAASSSSIGSEGKSKEEEEEEKIEHIDHLERWEEVFAASKSPNNSTSTTLIVKFTADWCKPCKAIQPAYIFLAEKFAKKCKFTTLDIDGDDCDVVSTKMKVAMMPTFVCFKEGVEVGRMSGGNDWDKLGDWVTEMCS